jgi:hypothetical protein
MANANIENPTSYIAPPLGGSRKATLRGRYLQKAVEFYSGYPDTCVGFA